LGGRCVGAASAFSSALSSLACGQRSRAIRENEQRARFLGYRQTVQLLGFAISAVWWVSRGRFGLQSSVRLGRASHSRLFGRAHRDGCHRGNAQLPRAALGALFYILFREFLSIWTSHWLLYFGILFVAFIVFSPTGLVGVGQRLLRRSGRR
jgi:ABC-type branched-subunit amino acid transport system permease subunit